jgi:hypothetical protein
MLSTESAYLFPNGREVHSTSVVLAAFAFPGDDLVGNLIGDYSVPFFVFASDSGFPMKSLIIQLSHLLGALHEAWKFLELGPRL